MLSHLIFAGLVALAAALPTADLEACPAPMPCASYTLMNTRGTTEPQGESLGFTAINANVSAARPGGKIIINQIHSTLATNADECFILEGYSQGATATVDALGNLTDAAFAAVKGVFLIGDPVHKAGLACNVDMAGGNSTFDVDGVFIAAGLKTGIPSDWVPKTLDVCNYGDGICDTKHGDGITIEHIEYIMDEGVHKLGAEFILKQLKGGSAF
ncbi:Cutinase [Akanthomyces lecanii RCEF 1005]|uniref:Cutinase n=1 Tax=Akanthomyces lecanii RCEF 1005 TaxID=1081108 RepID=A0A162JJX8_CORDF|nr:Cutinase [Akanthomyces lecanii RCEF 1005]